MFKTIKNLMRLSNISEEDIKVIVKEKENKIGDGKAVFFGLGTEDEWKEEEKERKGFKNIFGTGL